jgi:hypothetical protein
MMHWIERTMKLHPFSVLGTSSQFNKNESGLKGSTQKSMIPYSSSSERMNSRTIFFHPSSTHPLKCKMCVSGVMINT